MNRTLIAIVLTAFCAKAISQKTQYKNIGSSAFHEQVKTTNGTLLDVRTASEYANGHITNAGQLNYYAPDFKQKLLLLPSDQPIYLYCNTGWRSKRAAQILSENGYNMIYNLEKGIMEWNLENLPVVVEPYAQPDAVDKMESDEFLALIQSDKPVFVDFYAPWCAPCRKMLPVIDSLHIEYNDKITIVKINVDASKKLVKELQLGSVPCLVLYQKGKIIFSHTGIASKEHLTLQFKPFL